MDTVVPLPCGVGAVADVDDVEDVEDAIVADDVDVVDDGLFAVDDDDGLVDGVGVKLFSGAVLARKRCARGWRKRLAVFLEGAEVPISDPRRRFLASGRPHAGASFRGKSHPHSCCYYCYCYSWLSPLMTPSSPR